MDNKLSELSKPVAEIRKYYPLGIDSPAGVFFQPMDGLSAVNFGDFLYSQEYVSALLAELEAKDKRIANLEFEQGGYGYSVLEDLNGKIKRIAELEAYNARLRDWNLGLAQESWELQAKLATPVRLPELCGDGDNDTEYTEGLNDGITQSAIYLRRQGFKVEGDE